MFTRITHLTAAVLIATCASLANADESTAATQPVDAAKSDGLNVPPKPEDLKNKSNEQTIFEGMYTAEVHNRYHLAQATKYKSQSWYFTAGGSMLAIVGFFIPFIFRGSGGTIPRMTDEKRKELPRHVKFRHACVLVYRNLKSSVSNFVGLCILLIGVGLSYWSPTDDYHENARLADEWNALANQWKTLDRERLELSSAALAMQIKNLDNQRLEIESNSPKWFDVEVLRAAQHAENDFLEIKNTKKVASAS